MSINYSAYVIPPVEINDGNLIDCNVPEPDFSKGEVAWSSEKNYSIGDVVVRVNKHRRYKALVAGASAVPPEDSLIASAGAVARWLDIGATHRYSMFDNVIGTQTINSSGYFSVDLAPGPVEGIALLELVGQRIRITMFESRDANSEIAKVIDENIDGSVIEDFNDWFFSPYEQLRNFVNLDLPGGYWNSRVRIEIFGESGAGCGVLGLGRLIPIGETLVGAGVGITNFGKVEVDDFGNRKWYEGSFAQRVVLPIVADRKDFSKLSRRLSEYRSKPAIYIGSIDRDLDALICFGVYKDLYITIPDYPNASMNLEIDSLNNI